MGKSTISKRVIHNIIKKEESIPVFVELRKLQKPNIESYISTLLKIEEECLIDVLNKMPVSFIFDGVDEIEISITKETIDSLKSFIGKIKNQNFLITSRHEIYLSEFHDFTRYNIEPMTREESYSLITKYDPTGMISTKLISGIRHSNDSNINDFLSTPLYVSLLFCSYRHKTVIPQKKFMFYSQVYEALFESHDLSKDVGYTRKKHSGLDSLEFHTILRRLGFYCLKNGGKIEFLKDELEIITSNLIRECPDINCSSSNFVKDITTTVPLFVKEGSNIRWSHKSLMEYFSAMFICHDAKEKSNDLLVKMYSSSSWQKYITVFELCADINYTIFKSSIAEIVLSDYIEKCETYCQNKNNKIKTELAEERFCLSYGSTITINCLDNTRKDLWFENFLNDHKDGDNHKEIHAIIDTEGTSIAITTHKRKEHYIIKIIANKSECTEAKRNKKYAMSEISLLMKSNSDSNLLADYSNQDPDFFLNRCENFERANEILKLGNPIFLPIEIAKKIMESIRKDRTDGIDSLLEGF